MPLFMVPKNGSFIPHIIWSWVTNKYLIFLKRIKKNFRIVVSKDNRVSKSQVDRKDRIHSWSSLSRNPTLSLSLFSYYLLIIPESWALNPNPNPNPTILLSFRFLTSLISLLYKLISSSTTRGRHDCPWIVGTWCIEHSTSGRRGYRRSAKQPPSPPPSILPYPTLLYVEVTWQYNLLLCNLTLILTLTLPTLVKASLWRVRPPTSVIQHLPNDNRKMA